MLPLHVPVEWFRKMNRFIFEQIEKLNQLR